MTTPPTPPAPPVVDLVTSLQEALGRLNAMLFNYIGALQRDAPPQALKQEPLVAPAKAYDVQAQAELMSKDLLAGLRDVEALIQQLPGGGGNEPEEVAQAVELLQQNARAAEELQAELGAAGAKLAQLQDAHGVLAEAALAQRAAAAAAEAASGGPAAANGG
ncbi:hypothetical protein ABPG75_005045 [Micractinium tetrahymenae]